MPSGVIWHTTGGTLRDSGVESVWYRRNWRDCRDSGLNLWGMGDDWRDCKDSGAESVGYGGRLEGPTGTLWLNLSGIGDDWRDLGGHWG